MYTAGLSGLGRAAAGGLSEPPENSKREGTEADKLPEGAGES